MTLPHHLVSTMSHFIYTFRASATKSDAKLLLFIDTTKFFTQKMTEYLQIRKNSSTFAAKL